MALYKIKDLYPDYPELFGNHDIVGYSLYADHDDRVGSVDDVLVDQDGRIRYLVVSTGVWIFGKNVLLPIGRARIDYGDRRVYVDALTREQVEDLPKYDSDMTVDPEYEERVRGVYRPHYGLGRNGMSEADIAAMSSAPMGNTGSGAVGRDPAGRVPSAGAYDVTSYAYDQDPELYTVNDQAHGTLRVYEERLIAMKANPQKR
jgi:hypothetical protein